MSLGADILRGQPLEVSYTWENMVCLWLPQGREVAARAVRLALPCFTPLHLKGVTLGGSLPCPSHAHLGVLVH